MSPSHTHPRLLLGVVAFGVAPVLTAPAVELQYSLAADAANFQLGSAIVGLDDLDGDGVPELAVSDRSALGPGDQFGSGIVYVLSGADGGILREHEGTPAPSRSFGAALAALDADGDGIRDLAVGAPGQSDPVNGFGSGAVSIFSGADGSLLHQVAGPGGSQYGSALANAGDHDGDGRDDLFVGAPGASGSLGAVFLQSGADGSNLDRFDSAVAAASFGVALVALDDLDGDNRRDLAVAAPDFRTSGGNPAGRIAIRRSSDGTEVAAITGSLSFERLGASLAAAPDLDGDGRRELMVGSYSGGGARVVSGTDLATLRDLSLTGLPSFQPLTVGGSVDVDADGIADFLLGSPALGDPSQLLGGIRAVSGSDGSSLFDFAASEAYSGLGLVIAPLPGLGFAAAETSLPDPLSGGRGLVHVWEVPQFVPVSDRDGDGIPDDEDANPDSILTPTVLIAGIDSRVENRVDENGVSLADRFAELADPGDYRRPLRFYGDVLRLRLTLYFQGLIDWGESRLLRRAAFLASIDSRRRRR